MVKEMITITSKTKQRGRHLWEKKIVQNYCRQSYIFLSSVYAAVTLFIKKKRFHGSGNKMKKKKNNKNSFQL